MKPLFRVQRKMKLAPPSREAAINVYAFSGRFLGNFWRNVERAEDGCWLWRGYRGRGGYGRIRWRNRHYRANRLMLAMVLGRDLRPGMVAAHRCDNARCVRPSHLYEATQRDNAADRVAAGSQSGERAPNARLTAADARAIRAALDAGERHAAIAARHGVARATVTDIAMGRTWTSVQEACA